MLAHAVLLRDRLRSTAVALVRAGFDGVLVQLQNGLEEDGRVHREHDQWPVLVTVLAASREKPEQVRW